jgi:hypothetical protein
MVTQPNNPNEPNLRSSEQNVARPRNPETNVNPEADVKPTAEQDDSHYLTGDEFLEPQDG